MNWHTYGGPVAKLATGIPGFDLIAYGGLPEGRSTLLSGTSGSAKTVFASQFLVEGIRRNEPGVFVTFEESPEAIRKNMDQALPPWAVPERWTGHTDTTPVEDLHHAGGVQTRPGGQRGAFSQLDREDRRWRHRCPWRRDDSLRQPRR